MKNLFTNNKQAFSVEVFPPKKESQLKTVKDTVVQLKSVKPDYVSVTYGAAGNDTGNTTVDLAGFIQNEVGIETVAHLICVRFSKEEVKDILNKMEGKNLTNVLALRGDIPTDGRVSRDFFYAKELIGFIKKSKPDFYVSAACYPETHFEASSPESDLFFLKEKVGAGVNHLVSQLFFDNNKFFSFLQECDRLSISVPVQAGIMPVTNAKQIEKMVSLSSATMPLKLRQLVEKYKDNPEDMKKAGIEFASAQIEELLNQGVSGIHLYSMNNALVVKEIYNNTKNSFRNRESNTKSSNNSSKITKSQTSVQSGFMVTQTGK